MTTIFEDKVRCGLCGTESEYPSIASTNRFGSPDLDTRPPEMERSTLFAWVQRCPQCGYCGVEVSKTRPGTKVVVNTKEYRDQLNDPAFPELANSFLCQSIIDRDSGAFDAATWALIHAAWACDDAGQPDEAATCRRRAAEMLAAAEEQGQSVTEQNGGHTAILADLLRRSGQFEKAREAITKQRPRVTEDTLIRILDFQISLLDRKDTSCHTCAEAFGAMA